MSEQELAEPFDLKAESKKLRRHFEFTEADLMANQSGVLSEKQVKRVAREGRGGKMIGLAIGAILLLVPIVFGRGTLLWFQWLDQMKDLFWIWILWGGAGLIIALFVLLAGLAGIFLIVSQIIGKAPSKLLSIRGRARLVKGHGDRFSHIYYDLYINDHEFDGDSSMNKTIIEGAEYVVYYLEKVERIMSLELIQVTD